MNVREGEGKGSIKPWDGSETFEDLSAKSSKNRLIGHILIILAPTIFSLYLGFEKLKWQTIIPDDTHSILWVIGLFLTLFILWEFYKAHRERLGRY